MLGQKIKERMLLFRVRRFEDKQAFGELYDIYADPLFRYVYLKLDSKEVAEDLVSEVFLKVWNLVRKEEEIIENFRPFIYRVARNTVIDFYRKNKEEGTLQVEIMEIVDHKAGPLENTEKVLAQNEMEAALKKLKAEYREIIALHYIDEMSVGEIAETLGKSRGAARVLLHRAKSALKEMVGN